MNTYTVTTIEQFRAYGAKENVPLSELTSFRIGGNAAFVWEVNDYRSLAAVLAIAEEGGVPVYLLGKGTNILASDAGYSGLVIRFDRPTHAPVFVGNTVRVCAGTSLTQLAKETVAQGFMGMERLSGIPGTVGGACAMNAGAYGAEIKQILSRVHVLENGTDRWIDVNPDEMGYRKSPFSFPQRIVLEAELRLLPDDGGAAARMQDCTARRREKQPIEYPSAGSVFKRPEGYFAGALIEQCGLKGRQIGGAQVSEKHAGFIINRGGATENDVSALIAEIQATVTAERGVRLECEIKRMGDGVCIS
ncbi:MAG: UDP-N-acetylmuramate dehydrogenase [Clostridia bacterium]|nr:UDP-N-acetylmuramate dehydrogenase [Clostridia bacterium]